MALPEISTKRVAISKANAQMVGVIGIASFVTVFCLIASKAVLSQISYQSNVTKVQETAHRDLESNLKAYDSLRKSYLTFDAKDPNVLVKSSTGDGPNEGSNSKIILNALPSSYDFPALTSTIEKVLADKGLKATEITGIDDQLAQQPNYASASPKAVAIPFTFKTTTSYKTANELIADLQKSTRPIQIDSLTMKGGTENMKVTVTGHTYYQPGKNVNITSKVVNK